MEEKIKTRKRGEEKFKELLKKVNGLKSLPKEWRDALIPKDSEAGKKLLERMQRIDQTYLQSTGKRYTEEFSKVQEDCRKFFEARLKLYEKGLKSEKAASDVQELLQDLESLYRDAYAGTSKVVITEKGLHEWRDFTRVSSELFSKKTSQSKSNLAEIMRDAVSIHEKYV